MNSKPYTVLLYPEAQKDLTEIKTYYLSTLKQSPKPLFTKFLRCIDLLEANPFIRPPIQDEYLAAKGYRMMLFENYLLFYVIKNREVQIHRVLYGRREYGALL